VLLIVSCLGGLSALLGASAAIIENDIKRIIAYSTISQLGYMLIASGLSQYNLALFHLLNHSFFKALLFLSAGAIIHTISDIQDIRRMGSLILLLPWTSLCIMMGSLSLMAFPFLTGYYSKDLIIDLLGALMSALYSIRMMIIVLLSLPSMSRTLVLNLEESSLITNFSLFVLYLGTIYWGYLTHELFVGIGS
ncbi:NADH:ubiquinone dehydrogenase subunit 5, partial [Irineochytrium annulatum]